MTRPAPYRRSSAKERRQHRADFKMLKERVDASSEMVKRQAKARGDNQRAKARHKVKGALSGEAIRPFSALQAARIKSAEHNQLHQEFARRVRALSVEERRRLTERQYLLFLSFSVSDLRVIANAPIEGAT